MAIVNDYEIVVAGLAALMTPYAERLALVECDANRLPTSDVDVVLYDTFGSTRGRGVDIEALVRATSAPVVVFSWTTDAPAVTRALERGATGYVDKAAEPVDMVEAIEAAAAGRTVVPQSASRAEPRGAWPGQTQGLTAREAEVLSLITQGLSNQEIADRCYLSINSVKTYIRTAYRKMGVTRRSQAVLWGLSHGFEPDQFRSVDRDA